VPYDDNSYVPGRIHGHNVAIAYLSVGVYGTVSLVTGVNNILKTFPVSRFGLMVDIEGGIPGQSKGMGINPGRVSQEIALRTIKRMDFIRVYC